MNDEPRTKRVSNFDQLYAGRFLKAGELLGKHVTLTIADVYREELQGEDAKKWKAVIAFKESEKQMIACKTNGLCLREMFGNEVANWIGKRITIFPDTWNGEPCIRIWGSPDIERDIEVTIALPRRRPFKKTMVHFAPRPRQEFDAEASRELDREVE